MGQKYEDLPIALFRPDGTEGSIEKVTVTWDGVKDSFVQVDDGYSTAAYTHAEVAQLGDSDPGLGIRRLSKRAIFGDPTVVGEIRPFNDEIEQVA